MGNSKLFMLVIVFCFGCSGPSGQDGASCTAVDNQDGTFMVECPDGTSFMISDGRDGSHGSNGEGCTAVNNQDGTYTLECADGTSFTVSDGADSENCTVIDNVDGSRTIACQDGSSVTVLPANGGALYGDVTIENSWQLEQIMGYSEIFGNVTISGLCGIGILNLPNLEYVGGSLQLSDSDVTAVSMPRLSAVGSLSIQNNQNLVDISSLDGLTEIDGTILFEDNTMLSTLFDSSNVIRMNGDISLRNNNPNAYHCDIEAWADSFINAGYNGSLMIEGYVSPCDTAAKADCDTQLLGCKIDCTFLNDYTCTPIICENNYSINSSQTDPTLLECNTIVGDLTIDGYDAALQLDRLQSISGQLYILNMNPDTISFANLKSVGSVQFINIFGPSTLSGFDSLTDAGAFDVKNSDSLTDIAGFNNLISTGNITIEFNTNLTQISGFASLEAVNHLILRNSDSMTDIHAFNELLTTNDIIVTNNSALVGLSGFARLTSAHDISISLINSSDFKDISGFNNLISVNNLSILDSPSSTNFNNISGFTSIEEIIDLNIKNNLYLTEITGFKDDCAITNAYIEDNSSLGSGYVDDFLGRFEISGDTNNDGN